MLSSYSRDEGLHHLWLTEVAEGCSEGVQLLVEGLTVIGARWLDGAIESGDYDARKACICMRTARF